MNKHRHKEGISKKLSYALRHKPEKFNLTLDTQGWCVVEDLLSKLTPKITMAQLEDAVWNNDKQRFSFNENKTMIRANQGHSIEIDLQFKPVTPPSILYHGTADKFIDSIMQEGIVKKNRHHVHLSDNIDVASKVGKRHGKLIILEIEAMRMRADGYIFFLSENKVWLTDIVPKKYIKIYQL